MKVHSIVLVLFIALVSENQSIKVHQTDQSNLNSLTSQHRQVRQHQQQQTSNNVVTDPVTNNGQNVVPTTHQNSQYGYTGNEGQDSNLNYYYPQQQQQEQQVQNQQPLQQQVQNQQPLQQQVQNQQPLQQQQQPYQFQYPQLQQQYYYPNYYPQHQNFLYPDKTRRTQGQGGSGQDDGILGGLFSGVFDMLGLSDDNDDHGQGWSSGMMSDGGGLGGGLGGLGGLGGFIKGKKAGWLARGAVGLLLSPIILPIIVLWIAAIVLIIYFIPIPVIDPGNPNNKKRNLKSDLYSPIEETMKLARSVLQSDECVERVSCEIARVAKGYNIPAKDWIEGKMDLFNNKWLHRVSRSFKAVRGGGDCKQFSCATITTPLQKITSLFYPVKPFAVPATVKKSAKN